ncbi:MAG: alpha/beta hydrolase fold domain-containing protein [Bacteroidales bacterium]|nr:alpha/beta hydrolase fold domain-containing protein [Bacteroidales bacterium]
MKKALFAAAFLTLAACAQGHKVPADYVALPEGVSVETYTYAVKGSDTLQLDFYRNAALDGPQPTFIYVHGGSWADGTRKDAKWIGRVAKHGLNAVSISYRLANKGKEIGDSTVFGAQFSHAITVAVEDLYDATRYLLDNGEKLGVDPAKVIISGGSAGATNCVMAEYWRCNGEEIATSRLPEGFRYAGVIPWAGGVWKIGMERPEWKEQPAPHMFCHGTKDWIVPFWDQMIPASNFGAYGPQTLSSIFRENGWPYETLFVEEADHYMALGPSYMESTPTEKVDYTGQMLDFIDRFILDGQKIQIDYTEKDLDGVRDLKKIFGKNLKLMAAGKVNTGALPQYSTGAEATVETFTYAIKGADTLRMDVYRDPSFTGKRPVLIYAFPGGWEGGTRKDMGSALFPLYQSMSAKGYVVVGIDYRLGYRMARNSGRVEDTSLTTIIETGRLDEGEFAATTMDAIEMAVEDLYDATSFVVKHAKQWNIDPEQVIAMGGSAGAGNVLTAEYWRANGMPLAKEHLPKGFSYAAVIPCAGAIWHKSSDPVVWKSKPCPIVFFHGTEDQLIPYSETLCPNAGITVTGPDKLAEGLEAVGASYVIYAVEGADHQMAALPCGYLNSLLNGLIDRVAINGEQIQARFTERSLEEPHTADWFIHHHLGLTDEMLQQIIQQKENEKNQ